MRASGIQQTEKNYNFFHKIGGGFNQAEGLILLHSCNEVNLYTNLKNKHFITINTFFTLPSIPSSQKSP